MQRDSFQDRTLVHMMKAISDISYSTEMHYTEIFHRDLLCQIFWIHLVLKYWFPIQADKKFDSKLKIGAIEERICKFMTKFVEVFMRYL